MFLKRLGLWRDYLAEDELLLVKNEEKPEENFIINNVNAQSQSQDEAESSEEEQLETDPLRQTDKVEGLNGFKLSFNC